MRKILYPPEVVSLLILMVNIHRGLTCCTENKYYGSFTLNFTSAYEVDSAKALQWGTERFVAIRGHPQQIAPFPLKAIGNIGRIEVGVTAL